MKAARSHGKAADFVIADRGIDRQHDRRHFRRRPQPQVDAKGIAVLGPLLEQLDQPLADPHRRLLRLLARPPRQRLRIVEEDEVDVGGIIELAAAELAERDHREAASPPRRACARRWRRDSARSSARSARSDSSAVTRSSGSSPARSAIAERQREGAALAPRAPPSHPPPRPRARAAASAAARSPGARARRRRRDIVRSAAGGRANGSARGPSASSTFVSRKCPIHATATAPIPFRPRNICNCRHQCTLMPCGTAESSKRSHGRPGQPGAS